MFYLSTAKYTIKALTDTRCQLDDFGARHKVIQRALTEVGYTVKSAVHTYPPGRAAVLPLVIVKAVRTW